LNQRGQGVDQKHRDHQHERDRLNNREIQIGGRLDKQPANAGPRKNRLDDD
jgi:hypothetical protein